MAARLVVAVHDIAPRWIDEVRYLLQALDESGVHPRVLKVIPKDLPDGPHLQALLHEEQAHGSEIVLHGYAHETAGPFRGPLASRVRARFFARHAAEFLSLSPAEMTRRVQAGREILQQAGLTVRGFCAPGWLAPPELPFVLRDQGFAFCVRMTALLDLNHGRHIPTAWLGYMGSDTLHEQLVEVANRLTRGLAPSFDTLKIFLHPQGAVESPACRRVLRAIPELMRGRTLVTYGQLVAG